MLKLLVGDVIEGEVIDLGVTGVLLEENGQEWSEVITLDYRMTPATAVESNRQSW